MKEALGGVHVNLTFLNSYDIIRYSHPWNPTKNHLENPGRAIRRNPMSLFGEVTDLAYHRRSRQETHPACPLFPGRSSEELRDVLQRASS